MSINLILQKNNILLLNLYQIGYGHRRIGKFYQTTISFITLVAIILAIALSSVVRSMYLKWFEKYLDVEYSSNLFIVMGLILSGLLLFVYNFQLTKSIKKIVIPKKSNII